MVQSPEAEKLVRDIATLRESIKLDNKDIANLHLSGAELIGVLKHIAWCMQELASLQARLTEVDDA